MTNLGGRDSVANSLRLCVELATTPVYERDGRQASGFAAYEKWIEFLGSRASGPDAQADRIAYELHANAVIYHCLLDARGAAGRYLRNSGEHLNGAVREHMLRAADHYEEVFHILRQHAPQIPVPWTPDDSESRWTADSRRAQADALRSALACEKKAVAEIRACLNP